MVPPGESTQYHPWSVLAKKIERKSDQISRSNYQFIVWDGELDECLNNNPDLRDKELRMGIHNTILSTNNWNFPLWQKI